MKGFQMSTQLAAIGLALSPLRLARQLARVRIDFAAKHAGIAVGRLSMAERGLPGARITEIERARLRELYASRLDANQERKA
jgi:hypothetical protein